MLRVGARELTSHIGIVSSRSSPTEHARARRGIITLVSVSPRPSPLYLLPLPPLALVERRTAHRHAGTPCSQHSTASLMSSDQGRHTKQAGLAQEAGRSARTFGSARSFALMRSSLVSLRFVIVIGSRAGSPMGVSNSTPAWSSTLTCAQAVSHEHPNPRSGHGSQQPAASSWHARSSAFADGPCLCGAGVRPSTL
jgi:hypothetical protein